MGRNVLERSPPCPARKQLFSAIYKKTVTRSSVLNAALTFFLMAPFNIMGEILGRLLPKNADLYLDNIVLAKKT